MKRDYKKVSTHKNLNDDPSLYKPLHSVIKTASRPDNYRTEYNVNYLESPVKKTRPYLPEEVRSETKGILNNTEYQHLTKSAKKPYYSPLKQKKNKLPSRSEFKGKSIYQKDYLGSSQKKDYRVDPRTTTNAFETTMFDPKNGKIEKDTIYRKDYVRKPLDRNRKADVDAFRGTALPKVPYHASETVYTKDYVPFEIEKRRCPIDEMPRVDREVREKGGHVYFDADYDEWHGSESQSYSRSGRRD